MKKMFIGGRWMAAQNERSLPVVAPADGQPYDQIARGMAHEVNLAVGAARAALDAGAWGRMTATERGRVLGRIGQAVLDHTDELARIESRGTGKPTATARNDIVVLARYSSSAARPPTRCTAR